MPRTHTRTHGHAQLIIFRLLGRPLGLPAGAKTTDDDTFLSPIRMPKVKFKRDNTPGDKSAEETISSINKKKQTSSNNNVDVKPGKCAVVKCNELTTRPALINKTSAVRGKGTQVNREATMQ